MLSRSEKARQEATCRHFAESGIRRETDGRVARSNMRWTNAERSTAVTQLHHKPEWSPETDDILRELVDAGAPINVICSRLKCSCDAVRTRVLVLRLSVRSPG